MGALGPVFRTYEPTRDRLVAVKVFRLDITPEQAQVLADELAQAAEAELFHPSIVEPIAAGVEGTVAYRAEEYVAAESLDVAMRHYAPASFDTMMRIIGQLAEAIDVARGAGVGHGALHPRDIFVTPDDARASGFGVVDALERVGLRAPVRRPYSAPERIAGAQWSTPADVFSLGTIAFELLTGRRPSGTGEEMGPLTGAVAAHADRLQAILARAMHESPGERFTTGLAFADALASAGAPPAQASASDSAAAAPDESVSPVIQMIPIPSEAPEFADEEVGDAVDTAVSEEERAAAGPPVGDETADVAAERDEDVALWALTGEEAAAAARAAEAYDAEAAVIEHDAEVSRTLQADETATDDADAEAAADALVFDAAALAIGEESPAPEFRDEFRASAHAREAHLQIEPDVTSEQAEDERAPAFAPLFNRPGSPPQIVERDLRPDPAHDAHDRVPFEHLLASVDRPRSPMLDRAITLLVGLLIGFGAGYIAAWRGQPSQTVASTNVSTTTPGAAEPQGTPAGTPGTAADAGERPAAPAAAPATPRERAPAAPPASARSGSLVVRSMPPGAAVTINGKWSGRTPLTREALAFGDYTVRVLLPGYQTRNEQVNLSADSASRTLSMQLQQEAASSRATGAPAAGRPQAAPGAAASAARPGPAGSATPPTPAGSATLPTPAGSAAPPAPGASAARPGPASAAPTGTLEIYSRPAGARVFVDDQSVGTTPVRVPDVTPGSHVVRLELADHRTWTEVARVARGKTARVAGSLEPIR